MESGFGKLNEADAELDELLGINRKSQQSVDLKLSEPDSDLDSILGIKREQSESQGFKNLEANFKPEIDVLKAGASGLAEGLLPYAKKINQLNPFMTAGTDEQIDSGISQAQQYLSKVNKDAVSDLEKETGISADAMLPELKHQDYIRKPKNLGESAIRNIAGAGEGIYNLIRGGATPRNAGLLAAGALNPVVAGIEGLSFLPGMIEGTAESGKRTYKSLKRGDYPNATKNLVETLGTGAMAYGLGKHLTGIQGPTPVESFVPEDIPNAVLGDFQPLAEKGIQQARNGMDVDLRPKQLAAESELTRSENIKKLIEPKLQLPQNTPSTEAMIQQKALNKLESLPKSEELSQKTPEVPKFQTLKGPETTRQVTRTIRPEKKVLIDAERGEPGAFYDFDSKRFVKEVDAPNPIYLGKETVPESTSFTVKEETTPESPQTLAVQNQAMLSGRTKAMLVTPGASVPEFVSPKFKTVDTSVGTWIYDPMKITRNLIVQKVMNGTHGEILGHVEPKSPKATQIVTAIDPSGVEAKTSVVSPENAQRQAAILKDQFPDSTIQIGGDELANEVLAQRSSDGPELRERGVITSAKNAETIPDELKESVSGQYERQNQADVIRNMQEEIAQDKETARQKLFRSHSHSGETVALALEIAKDDIAKGDISAAHQIIEHTAKKGTTGGQASAMYAQLDRDTSAGALLSAVQEINSAREALSETKKTEIEAETKSLIQDLKKINEETLNQVSDETSKVIETITNKKIESVKNAKAAAKIKSIAQLLSEAIGGEIGAVGELAFDPIKAAAREEIIRRVEDRIKQTGQAIDAVLSEFKIDPKIYTSIKNQSLQDAQISSAQKIANTADRSLKQKSSEAQLDDPVATMVKILSQKARENLPKSERVPSDPLQLLAESVKNRQFYGDTFERAKQIVENQFKDNPEALDRLRKFLNDPSNPAYANSLINKSVSAGIKSSGTNLSDIVKNNFSYQDKFQKNLIEKLVSESGLSGEDAAQLAQDISNRFEKLATEKKEQLLKSKFSQKSLKKSPKLGVEKLIELSNLGAFDHPEFKEKVAEKLGFPSITTEQSAQIVDLGSLVESTKKQMLDGGDRLEYGRALVAMNNYINKLKSAGKGLRFSDFKEDAPKATWESIKKIGGIAKSLKASLDNSVIGKQGFKVAVNHPEIWFKNSIKTFSDMVKTFGKKEVIDEVMADVLSRPNSVNGDYKKEGLAVGRIEEDFPETPQEKIPYLGKLFKTSDAAFTAFQYRTRADIFDKIKNIVEESGGDIKGLGKLANSLTGRGDLGKIEPVANTINNLFFSPRFLKSNIDILTGHALDRGMSQAIRKQAIMNTVRTISAIAAIQAIAYAVNPKSVETDSTSSDFGKIKVGNTRYDIAGGIPSLYVLASRLWNNHSKSSVTGQIKKLNTGDFGSKTSTDVIFDFLGNKISPLLSVARDIVNRSDRDGNPITLWGELKNLGEPLPIKNQEELSQDHKTTTANRIAASIADFFGFSTNTYSRSSFKKK